MTPEDPLVLESTNDNATNYPDEEFTNVTDEDGATQRENDEDDGKESIGDHGESDPVDDEEDHVERVELEGSNYDEGDD